MAIIDSTRAAAEMMRRAREAKKAGDRKRVAKMVQEARMYARIGRAESTKSTNTNAIPNEGTMSTSTKSTKSTKSAKGRLVIDGKKGLTRETREQTTARRNGTKPAAKVVGRIAAKGATKPATGNGTKPNSISDDVRTMISAGLDPHEIVAELAKRHPEMKAKNPLRRVRWFIWKFRSTGAVTGPTPKSANGKRRVSARKSTVPDAEF
jgi:hypothetical protein